MRQNAGVTSPTHARLYYHDAYLLTFDSTVIDVRPSGDRFEVALAASAFYPTSGGQLHDLGTLTLLDDSAPAHVTDVFDDEAGTVWHVVHRAFAPGSHVRGAIDAARRADHRRQHTGQHVLSASFAAACDAQTRSVHLGPDVCTLDLDRDMSDEAVALAETHANAVALDNREVHVRLVDAEEAAALPLRRPTHRTGAVRLVEIDGHDLSACGGTHVQRTGEIGAIVVLGTERFKGGSRVTFACGQRAVSSHRDLRRVLEVSARHLSVGWAHVPAAIARLQDDARTARRSDDLLRERLAVMEAQSLAQAFEATDTCAHLVALLEDADASVLRRMASTLVETPGRVVVLLGGPAPHALVVARSADLATHDAGRLARAIVADLGGKAGGRADLAQGGGVTASPAEVRAVVGRELG